jgi:NADPH:quinone reductase
MHAIVISRTGGSDVLEYAQRPAPEAEPGRLVVQVAAAGVNFVDTYHRSGLYPRETPFVPGAEGAGVVTAVGGDTPGFAVGDRVAWADGSSGSYAQFTTVDAARAIKPPETLGLDIAAASLLQGMTAHYLSTSTWPIQRGDTALVHAAAGGMGLLLTQLITARGGRVIATVSTPAKETAARTAGASEVIRYTEVPDLAAAVRDLTGGRGVDVVYDGVGKTTFDASLASLRPRGLLALYGAASGPVPPVDPQRLSAAGSVFLTRPTLIHYVATAEELAWRAGEILEAVAAGTLTISIGARYPLAEAAAAHTALESRATTGKILLLP